MATLTARKGLDVGTTDPEEQALVRAICAQPFDDLCRLRYADWLQERGESERSQFIRVQVELEKCRPDCGPGRICRYIGESTCVDLRKSEYEMLNAHGHTFINELPGWKAFHSRHPDLYGWFQGNGDAQVKIKANLRRGFVSRIECTLRELMGDECLRCEGHRWILGRRVPGDDPRYSMPCPACRGSGRTTGLVDTLFREQPVMEVVLVDRRPHQFDNHLFCWTRWGDQDYPSNLPSEFGREIFRPFTTSEAAIEFSSSLAVSLGRNRAGLPPI
jgi:uncharacterized protein (TIGR02996 family)